MMRVLFVSSEIYPLAKTGGLADVSWALPHALHRLGMDVRLLLPGYPHALDKVMNKRTVAKFEGLCGVDGIRLISGMMPDAAIPIWLIDAPQLYRRDGGPYQNAEGCDWPDNDIRFAVLAHAGARIGMGIAGTEWRPDIVHANDWHTGLLPLILGAAAKPRPATLFTIHNMAFQGNFPLDRLARLQVSAHGCCPDGLEFHNQISFLKAGIGYSDRLTTVSPTHVKEILSPEFGLGLEGLLQQRSADLSGILNGVDYDIWNPASDLSLPATYGPSDIAGKRICKASLQHELGLAVAPDVPLMVFVSRIAHQKMADILLEILPWIAAQNAQFALLGEGERELENAFAACAHDHPHKLAVRIGYQEPLAHRMQAGADILLAPSRFEPCGLTHLYAMRYGALPIVRRTGGLADTVIDSGRQTIADGTATGFVFDAPAASDMTACIARALSLYAEPLTWRRIQRHSMQRDFGWAASASQYGSLYRSLAGAHGLPVVRADEDMPAYAQSELVRQAQILRVT